MAAELTGAEIIDLAARAEGVPPWGEDEPDAPELLDALCGISESDLAARFSERHASNLRYVAAWDRWLIWNGHKWAHDERRTVFHLSRELCTDILKEQLATVRKDHQQKALRQRLGSASVIYAVTKLAGADPRHAVAVSQLDADPWSINTPDGIINLRTGARRDNDPAELHTKATAAAIGGECPLFEKTLAKVQPDQLVREYMQRLAGYALTGSSREHVVPFWYGGGRNGKGTVVHTLRFALGDYGKEIPAELLMERHNEQHPTEVANLHGARLIVGSEVDSNRRWNESRLRRLSGGDPISARFIGKDSFEFEPSHTMIIVGNNKPGLRKVDEAIKARLHLLDFKVTIPEAEQDQELPEKLKAEFGGILAWMLAGCIEWQAHKLNPPETVKAATQQYLAANDSIKNWLDEVCQRTGQIKLTDAHKSYREWCEKNSEPALGRNQFGDVLATHVTRDEISRSGVSVFSPLSLPIKVDKRYGNDE